MEERREQFAAAEIRTLEAEIETAEFIVEMSETEKDIRIEVRHDPEEIYESSVCGNVLSVRLKRRYGHKILRNHFDTSQIRLVLPLKKDFEMLCLKIGAGNADLSRMAVKCSSFHLETGVGNVRIGRLDVRETLEAEIGAGKVILNRIRAEKAQINCGVGNFTMNGAIGTDLDVDCGIGKCSIRLEGKQSDYDYDISCGIGSVSINGRSVGRTGCRNIRNQYTCLEKNTAGMIRISCGVGSVVLKTA